VNGHGYQWTHESDAVDHEKTLEEGGEKREYFEEEMVYRMGGRQRTEMLWKEAREVGRETNELGSSINEAHSRMGGEW
jgi:hypothetical protein